MTSPGLAETSALAMESNVLARPAAFCETTSFGRAGGAASRPSEVKNQIAAAPPRITKEMPTMATMITIQIVVSWAAAFFWPRELSRPETPCGDVSP